MTPIQENVIMQSMLVESGVLFSNIQPTSPFIFFNFSSPSKNTSISSGGVSGEIFIKTKPRNFSNQQNNSQNSLFPLFYEAA
jgi:hypothetical protein